MIRVGVLSLPLALLALGCARIEGMAKAAGGADPAPSARATVGAKPAPEHAKSGEHAGEDAAAGPARYGVPFAWEMSKDEPLAKARSYLSEMIGDNALNAGLGKEHFVPFAEKQAPRATVVACSDSRVQSSAWDATPENDAFTIRNIGNQVTNAHGSVAYALDHLHTPVLLVLGHTGCGAVKAAMGKLDELEPPIRAELAGLKVPALTSKGSERKAWADAVIANVNNQVAFAVASFGGLLREQKVSVVGAVYDFRNDLGHGYGRITFVNVNGNTEPERLKAFEAALLRPVPSGTDLLPGPGKRGLPGEAVLNGLLREQPAAAGAAHPADADEHTAAPPPKPAPQSKPAASPEPPPREQHAAAHVPARAHE